VKTKAKPEDIVFRASLRMERLADQWATFDVSEILARQGSDGAKRDRNAALDEAREYIGHIQSLGFHVLLDAPLPVFQSIAFRCSDWFNKMNPICRSGQRISKRFLEDHRRNTMNAISELKDEFPKLSVWDPFYRLCSQDHCSSWDSEGPLFFDSDHLTGHGNEVLYPLFLQSVENVWTNSTASASKLDGQP
jgi:hypothetical protein